MANTYTITPNTSALDTQTVSAYQSLTVLCSAGLAFTPVTGLSSFKIDNIAIEGASTNYTVSASRAFPFTVINGATSAILFNVTFNNATPGETTIAYPASAKIFTSSPALSAGSTGADAAITASSTAFTVSGFSGWRGQSGGKIWPTHKEHMRLRNLGYF